MPAHLLAPVYEIQRISAVQTILEAVAGMTGLRFVCIAHVTDDAWTACAVLDRLDFGVKVGDGLDVTTTLCEEVRDTRQPVVIDCVAEDEIYCNHHTPKIYGFQSYISIPIFRRNGDYFGTLCGLDPLALKLSSTEVIAGMQAFARLISMQLANESSMVETEMALLDERETSELREQFIAVLGHDLRTPLGSILTGIEILGLRHPDPDTRPLLQRIERSARRISALIDDVVDFTRGRMGGGIPLQMRSDPALDRTLEQVISELRDMYSDREIEVELERDLSLQCDSARLGQLLSNLLKNALVHGDPAQPVSVVARWLKGDFVMRVCNGGKRLTESVQEKLFKPFWRYSPDIKREGLGLGLFIVAEIARSHGGRIEVSSTDSQTCFTFAINEAGIGKTHANGQL